MLIFSTKPKWIHPIAKPMRYGYLKNVNTDQIAYATQASESAVIVSKDREHELRLQILRENYRHSDEKLYVAFDEIKSCILSKIITKHLPKGEANLDNLDVEFEVKHSYFDALVKAVNNLPSEVIKRILPVGKDFQKLKTAILAKNKAVHDVHEYFISLLAKLPDYMYPTTDHKNSDLFRALMGVLTCDNEYPPLLVSGPFGTGKTRLLAVSTYCIVQEAIDLHKAPVRILICAHHQSSADNFIDKYFGPVFSNMEQVELVRLVPKSYHHIGSLQFSLFYKTKFTKTNRPHLIIVTTFLTALSLSRTFQPGDFTHILLDEGAQAREPEAIVPLSLAGQNTKIVIAGDSKQVSRCTSS